MRNNFTFTGNCFLTGNTPSSKSLDVSAKQRLCYHRRALNLELCIAVSPHVNSIGRHSSGCKLKISYDLVEKDMEKIIALILILVGLINFYPTVGVLSAKMLSGLYVIDIQDNNVLILLRHRAILFGLLGAFLIYSAFKPAVQDWAVVIGLVSMLSFVVIAFLVGDYGTGIRKVIIADVIASVGLFIVLGLRLWFVKP